MSPVDEVRLRRVLKAHYLTGIECDLDRVEKQLKSDLSPNTAAMYRVERLARELRHVARYAQDAERGNEVLRAALRSVLEG